MTPCKECGHTKAHIGKDGDKTGLCLEANCGCTHSRNIPRSWKFRIAYLFTKGKLFARHKTVEDRFTTAREDMSKWEL